MHPGIGVKHSRNISNISVCISLYVQIEYISSVATRSKVKSFDLARPRGMEIAILLPTSTNFAYSQGMQIIVRIYFLLIWHDHLESGRPDADAFLHRLP